MLSGERENRCHLQQAQRLSVCLSAFSLMPKRRIRCVMVKSLSSKRVSGVKTMREMVDLAGAYRASSPQGCLCYQTSRLTVAHKAIYLSSSRGRSNERRCRQCGRRQKGRKVDVNKRATHSLQLPVAGHHKRPFGL